jgi:hypothetical protein
MKRIVIFAFIGLVVFAVGLFAATAFAYVGLQSDEQFGQYSSSVGGQMMPGATGGMMRSGYSPYDS